VSRAWRYRPETWKINAASSFKTLRVPRHTFDVRDLRRRPVALRPFVRVAGAASRCLRILSGVSREQAIQRCPTRPDRPAHRPGGRRRFDGVAQSHRSLSPARSRLARWSIRVAVAPVDAVGQRTCWPSRRSDLAKFALAPRRIEKPGSARGQGSSKSRGRKKTAMSSGAWKRGREVQGSDRGSAAGVTESRGDRTELMT
jgi:hypothetical protein